VVDVPVEVATDDKTPPIDWLACEHCHAVFRTQPDLTIHLHKEHVCRLCDEVFERHYSLLVHQTAKHGTDSHKETKPAPPVDNRHQAGE
jgi:uncharacterized C2H2 Zn-finger protein